MSIRPYAVLTQATAIKLAESLDAGLVMFGQYSLAPGTAPTKGSLRITGRILDVKRIRRGPELTEGGALEDLAALENHMAWQAVQALAPKTAPPEQDFVREHPPVRVDAIENYIRGLMATAPEQSHRFFTQAARLDARFSQPCFQLGRFPYAQEGIPLRWWPGSSASIEPIRPTSRRNSCWASAAITWAITPAAEASNCGRSPRRSRSNEVFNNLAAAQSRQNDPLTMVNFQKALDGDSADPDYHFQSGLCVGGSADSLRRRLSSFAPRSRGIPATPTRRRCSSGVRGRTVRGRAIRRATGSNG